LLDANGIKIGGYTIQQVKDAYTSAEGLGSDVIEDLFKKMQSSSLSITFTTGIFAQIAELTGSYNSSMTFPKGTEVSGLDLNMFGAMKVEVIASTGDNGSLGPVANVIAALNAPKADANAATTLTNTYGYIIDLVFRTNATESDLLLQTTAKNRYAEGAQNPETQGNGSNITFTVNAEYSADKIKGLAAGIRVVFFDNAGKILGVATPDAVAGAVSGDAYKMDLKLVNYTIDNEGVITIGAAKDDAKLCALTANEKTAISALVYLDGDVIDNADVGTNSGLQAMVNLQFASSVELKPMENADLMGEKAN
jgi:hypothetical protein